MRPLSAYKFFEDDNNEEENKISIMTMHKSKGDEFDYVFIPQMNEENYPLTLSNIKLKNGGHFVQSVKNALLKTGIKMPDVLKREQLEETLRLLYVGITRARKELYITTANNYKMRKNVKISEFIKNLCVN